MGGRFVASVEDETPRVEPDVDEARNDVVQDLFYSQSLAKLGFVKGAVPPDGASSSYRTDGLRTVLVFGSNAVSLAEVDFFDWERLVDHQWDADPK